jgi:hypothetical protein
MRIDFRFAILVVSAALFFGGCSQNPKPNSDVPPNCTQVLNEWQPTDPLPSKKVTYTDCSGNDVTVAWAQLDNEKIRKLLPNINAEISVAKLDLSGNITYLVAKASAGSGDYRVTMDYSQYLLEPVIDSKTKTEVGLGRIGVGMRMTADIHTIKADINLGSLFALGVAASMNKLRGTLRVDIFGIESNDVGNLIMLPSTLDEGSIQKTLESMAAIKAKISESNLTPYILAVKSTDKTYTTSAVKAKLLK